MYTCWYFNVHACQHNGCNWRFSGCLRQNVGKSGYAILWWSATTSYSASMLTEGVLKLTSFQLVNFEHPRSTSLSNIQCYLIMTQLITLQHIMPLDSVRGQLFKSLRHWYYDVIHLWALDTLFKSTFKDYNHLNGSNTHTTYNSLHDSFNHCSNYYINQEALTKGNV